MQAATKTKIKLVLAGLLAVLVVIFVVLNNERIEVNLIFGKIVIRRSVMIIATFLVGIFAGWMAHSMVKVRKKEAADRAN